MAIIFKTTTACVTQMFDEETGEFIEQKIGAGDKVTFEDENCSPISPVNPEKYYHSFED